MSKQNADPLRTAAECCPHSARQIDRQNPCSCGIWWDYDYGIEAWRPHSFAANREVE